MKTFDYLLSHNTLQQFALAVATAAAMFLILLLVRNIAARRLREMAKRTITIWDDVVGEVIAATKPLFLISCSIVVGVSQMDLPARIAQWPAKAMMVLLILQVGVWVAKAMDTAMGKRVSRSLEVGDGATVTNLGVIAFIARVAIWVLVLLLLLDNVGVNITTLVASMGIGGVAVALALQNILGDLFASLSIAMDKPFVIGDFIIVDDMMGTVKHVGLKTTRILSLSGEELVFSNNDLLKSRIRNYKHMAERRVVFGFGVTYDTPSQALAALVAEVRRVIEAQEGTRFDRSHFKGFGSSSLDLEVVYFMLSPDFNIYMDVQQRINLALLDYCNAQGIRFALPTQIIHVASMPPHEESETNAARNDSPLPHADGASAH